MMQPKLTNLFIALAMAPIAIFIISPTSAAQESAAKPYALTLPNSAVKIQMLAIPGGTLNGATVKPFYMSATEIPWEAFDAFIASGPPSKAYDQTAFKPDAIARPSKSYILPDLGWGHNGYPAINVSFTSVEMFCRWLSSVTKQKYRVPTELEWEFACRAGLDGEIKMDKATLDKSAWYSANSRKMTHTVGKKLPNAFGLFDMYGNVGEWATDKDGKPVLCGGTFLDDAAGISPLTRRRWSPKWQETDPQLPKSRWWLADGPFVGIRIVCQP